MLETRIEAKNKNYRTQKEYNQVGKNQGLGLQVTEKHHLKV